MIKARFPTGTATISEDSDGWESDDKKLATDLNEVLEFYVAEGGEPDPLGALAVYCAEFVGGQVVSDTRTPPPLEAPSKVQRVY